MPKQNPSLAGKSKYPHSPLWLKYEREILEWWITVREQHKHQLAPGLNDDPFLIAEKELLEWWHTHRETLK